MMFIPLKFLILFFCSILLQTHDVQTQGIVLQPLCSNTSNYTSGSQFQRNLNLLLSSLVSNGTRDGFFSTRIGVGGPETVYGLVQCRGDISMKDCQICLTTSAVEIIPTCPNGKEASLRYGNCILRYSDSNFFSIPDFVVWRTYLYANVSVADKVRFDQQLGILMNNISTAAATRLTRYISGSIDYKRVSDIYGMAQCTRDLSPNDCYSCLQTMILRIPTCCNNSIGVEVYSRTCYIRYELYRFFEVASQSPPPVAAPPLQSTGTNMTNTEEGKGRGKGNSTNAVVIASVIASAILIAVCAILITRKVRKTKRRTNEEIFYYHGGIGSEPSLQFDLNMTRAATNEFSDANKIGEGGFGVVYKGELGDGQEIAVKRLSKNSGQGSQEFKNEVALLHKLQHRNLVKLLGFCLGGEEKLLIYEYVPNGSLDKYIFDPTKRSSLDWQRRYKIIQGIGRGLLYLHEDSRLRIIHRDLKLANILLDEEMNAKIADFGMAKLFGVDQTQGNTSKIAGTYGYMAPEYALDGLFSVKSDVYSFGILLLEIISGRKTYEFHRSGPSRDLLSYGWKLWREGNALWLMDQMLADNYSTNEVVRCIQIGLLCVQENLEDRPTMSYVVSMLNNYSLVLETPSSPPYFLETITSGRDVRSTESTSSSLLNSVKEHSSLKSYSE